MPTYPTNALTDGNWNLDKIIAVKKQTPHKFIGNIAKISTFFSVTNFNTGNATYVKKPRIDNT